MVTFVKFENISFGFPKSKPLLRNVSFSIEMGKFYYLTGKSGSGKSTIIRLISGIHRSHSGLLEVFGRRYASLTVNEIALMRQEMGVIFQDFNLLNHLTLLQNVALPLRFRGYSWKESLVNAQEALVCVGLGSVANAFPREVSGGEQQRAVIARAMITQPKLILADEATGNLDDENTLRLMNLLIHLNKNGTTVLFATHNRQLIEAFPRGEFHLQEGCLNFINPRDDAQPDFRKTGLYGTQTA